MAARKKPKDKAWHKGGCHCGSVAFEVRTAPEVELVDCNCSMCAKTGYLHLIVKKKDFKLLRGDKVLTTYTFNTGVARHMFCAKCGVKSFYRPRSNPDGWSVNARCLDEADGLDIEIEAFDGQNWEANAQALAHLSRDPA